MAFGWGGAAGGAADARMDQMKLASDLENQLAERAYRNALIEQAKQQQDILRQRMSMEQQQFDTTQDARATGMRQAENERGVASMVGQLIQREGVTPQNRGQIVGTLMEAGRMPTQADLELPGGGDPFTLGPGQVRYGADGTEVARGNPAAADTPDPFTLSPGQIRYGADGQVVARGAPQASASSGQATRRVLSGDVNRIAEVKTAINDLDALEKQLGTTGAASQLGTMAPNWLTEATGIGSDAKSRQGTTDRVKQVIGKTLEGGVLRREDEYKYTKILPTIGDPPVVAKAKLQGLRTAIKERFGTQLDALEDAGFDVSNYRAREGVAAPTGGDADIEEWTRDANGKLVRAK